MVQKLDSEVNESPKIDGLQSIKFKDTNSPTNEKEDLLVSPTEEAQNLPATLNNS